MMTKSSSFFSKRRAFWLVTAFFVCLFPVSLSTVAAQESKSADSSRTLTVNADNTDRIIIVTKSATPNAKVSEASRPDSAKTSETDKPKLLSWETIKTRIGNFRKTHDVYFKGFTFYTLTTLFIGIIITLIVARIVRWVIEDFILNRFAHKTKTELDEMICNAVGRPASWVVVSLGIYISALPIIISTPVETDDRLFERLCLAMAAASIAWGVYRCVTVINHILAKLAEKTDNNLDDLIVAIIRKSLKIVIVVVSVLFIGQNILGLNITTLLAGAGVAGLAIAFAAQDTIANFFGSIMIILDKPFSSGDRIRTGGTEGIVEHVGFRSTRIRTLDGHLVTIPNKGLANDVLTNVSERPYIKEKFNFTITYDTAPEKVERAIEILHEIFDNQPCMNMEEKPPLISFNAFNDWALNILVVICYYPPDYTEYMQWLSKTNLEILKRFNDEGIEFAFPTNTTYLAYDAERQVKVSVDQV